MVEIYAPSTLSLDPGIETIVDVSLLSGVDAASVQYRLVFDSLEFVNHRWTTTPVHEGLKLDQRVSNRLMIEAPKRPECKAGVYKFWIEVNIRNANGKLESYRHPMDVTVNKFVQWRPKLIPNKAERPGAYIFQLTNLSNHTVQFEITGEEIPEDGLEDGLEDGYDARVPAVLSDRTPSCVFEIEPGKPILYPGQLGNVDVLVRVPRRRPMNPIKFKLNVEPQDPR
jgi:hypothetical protein